MHKLLDKIVQMTGCRPRLLVVDDDPVTAAILLMSVAFVGTGVQLRGIVED